MRNQQNTHLLISNELVGSVVEIKKNEATAKLMVTDNMKADKFGLIHGGFIFGLADYAGMLAVNNPNVVLGKAEVKILKPVVIEEVIIAKAKVIEIEGNKYYVNVNVCNNKEEVVFNGVFICFVKNKHVLE